jgi:MHS family proline/betaine transporter-like MFS transporter
MVEQAPAGRRGLLGAIAGCGATGGILMGSATGAFVAWLLPAEALAVWGWRIPFIVGLFVGGAGYLLRRHMREAGLGKHERSPVVETFTTHGAVLARLAGLAAFNAVGFYLVFVYLVSWLQFADGIAPAHALEINTISMALLLPIELVTGMLSDRIGRKPLMLLATGLAFIFALPLFWLLHHEQTALVLLGQFGFVLTIGMFGGIQPALMVEEVPASVRCTAVALGYNVTLGIVGGLTPLVATWLVHRTHNELSPAFMVMIAAAISFLSIRRFTGNSRVELPA